LGTLYQVHTDERLNHSFAVTAGVCAEECSAVLSNFFAELRAQKVQEKTEAELLESPVVEKS
ncbi:MAG: hypothetical protein LBB42_00070, partial [Coriobacteriales bacterium]|jgi:tRNA(adenine34) deaminase|nr:hypothetical protein [Coriobacteriales bacterium]